MDKNNINILEVIERETGVRFNREGAICCPFHGEKTPSFRIDKKKNRFKCFGCGVGGDAIDFIQAYRGLNYIEACKVLGIELDEVRGAIESVKDDVKSFVGRCWSEYKIRSIYSFTNEAGSVLYYKVKLIDEATGKKITPYVSIVDGKCEAKRNSIEVPYNLYDVSNAIKAERPIFIVEGEKDVETLAHLGYRATSMKGVKEFSMDFLAGATVYFVGDTGKAGEEYKMHIWHKLEYVINSFNVIELTDIETLGDNKDVTDWFDAGYTKEHFKMCIKNAWNWKKSRKWKYVKEKVIKEEVILTPLKVWQNLDVLLQQEGVNLRYNVINKEIEATGTITTSRNILITDIYALQVLRGLNMSRDETYNAIYKIAYKNKYNPFIEYISANRNSNYELINELFDCLELEPTFIGNIKQYYNYVEKWLLNVVKMAHNELNLMYSSQGILVLQGGQGIFKSTFFRNLMPVHDWFKGDMTLNPESTDSVKINTGYVLTEWGELDSTLKGEQAKLKQFITATSDEFRSPYDRVPEKYARKTSFCGTINELNFLKDNSGSRRFWIIPVKAINLEKLYSIDKAQLWGAVYDLWLSGTVKDYFDQEETKAINERNMEFASLNDTWLTIDENLNTSTEQEEVYNLSELCSILGIKEKLKVKNELERRGYEYKNHRLITGKTKKGFKLPKFSDKVLTGGAIVYKDSII